MNAVIGNTEQAKEIRAQLDKQLTEEKEIQTAAGAKAEAEAKEAKKDDKEVAKAKSTAEGTSRSRIRDLEKAIQEIDGRIAVVEGKIEEALASFLGKEACHVFSAGYLACMASVTQTRSPASWLGTE